MSGTVFEIEKLNGYYGTKQALIDVSLAMNENTVTAIIGPSGCGKSTLIRCLNRMNDLVSNFRVTGLIRYQGMDIFGPGVDVIDVCRKIGMVFQKPNPLPKSIYDNLAYALNIHKFPKNEIPNLIESALKESFLWEEVKDQLKKPAVKLSGGQQQRLCIARTVVLRPEVILMDVPCSALDPISTRKIEELIIKLKTDYTIVIVTHNMQQAKRISDQVAFMYMGELVEYGSSKQIFENPEKELTKNYVNGTFG